MLKILFFPILLCFHSTFLFAQTDAGIESPEINAQKESLNMLSIGYHIGGHSYIGAEFEYRFSKYIGLNAGAGISGITAGIKLHSCPCQTGPFLNISFKDGGFGNIGSLNCEIGGVLLPISKNGKIGLLGQIGYSKFIYLSESYTEKLSKQGKSKESAISFGIGISAYIW